MSHLGDGASTVDLGLLIDEICDEFVLALQANHSVRFEPFLQRAHPSARRLLIVELVCIHAAHRSVKGEAVSADDYSSQFPDQAAVIRDRLATLLSSSRRSRKDTTRVHRRRAASVEGPRVSAATQIGRYQVLQQLGEGGFGEVWEAYDPVLARTVAVKLLRPHRGGDVSEVEALLEEGRRVARLDHDNIVRVLDAGNAEGRVFLVSELMPGGTLTSRMAAAPIPVMDAVRWIETLARALQHAHDRGFVHRDIKPSNILFDSEDQPHLADFGLALSEEERLVEPPGTVGTATYMSPEQAEGNHAETDSRSDLYSLGLVLYRLLAGTLPPEIPTADQYGRPTASGHQSTRVANSEIPASLDAICLKCIQSEPEERYQSAAELADALLRWQDSLKVSNGRTLRRWVAAGLLATAGFGAVAVARMDRENLAAARWNDPLMQMEVKPPVWTPTEAKHFYAYRTDLNQFQFSTNNRAAFLAGLAAKPAVDLETKYSLTSQAGCVGLFWSMRAGENGRTRLRAVSVGRILPSYDYQLYVQEWTAGEFPQTQAVTYTRNVVDVLSVTPPLSEHENLTLRIKASGRLLEQVWLNQRPLLPSPVEFREPDHGDHGPWGWGVCGLFSDAVVSELRSR